MYFYTINFFTCYTMNKHCITYVGDRKPSIKNWLLGFFCSITKLGTLYVCSGIEPVNDFCEK